MLFQGSDVELLTEQLREVQALVLHSNDDKAQYLSIRSAAYLGLSQQRGANVSTELLEVRGT